MPFVLTPTGGNSVDLITLAYAQSALTEANLTAGQAAYLPSGITASSRAVMQWLGGQNVKQASYDQILPTSIDGYIFPPQQPLNYITRIATGRAAVLTIANTSSSIQWATVDYSRTGDVDAGLTATGVLLTWASGGATSTSTTLFSGLAPATVQSLANAINAVGSGWAATVSATYGGWATSELITDDVAAQDGIQGAALEVWSQNLTGAKVQRPGNVIDLRASNALQGASTQFAWSFGGSLAQGTNRTSRPQVRVLYNAGYAAVPPAIQQATVEVVKVLLERLKTEQVLSNESADGYTWAGVGPEVLSAIPKAARDALVYYRVRVIGVR